MEAGMKGKSMNRIKRTPVPGRRLAVRWLPGRGGPKGEAIRRKICVEGYQDPATMKIAVKAVQ